MTDHYWLLCYYTQVVMLPTHCAIGVGSISLIIFDCSAIEKFSELP